MMKELLIGYVQLTDFCEIWPDHTLITKNKVFNHLILFFVLASYVLCFGNCLSPKLNNDIYILLTKREGRTGGISARGLIFSQYGPEQAWLIRDLLHDWRKLLRFFTNYGFHLCYLSRSYSVFPLLELGTIIRPALENF